MSDTIKGSIIGALITGVISFLIFILGNFSTQDSIVESLSVRFDSVDSSMSYEQALQAIYEEVERLKVNNATLKKSINESKADNATLQSENENLHSEIDSLKNASNRSEQIALAESYASLGNYEVAMGNARARKGEWRGRGARWGEGIGDFGDSIWNVSENI